MVKVVQICISALFLLCETGKNVISQASTGYVAKGRNSCSELQCTAPWSYCENGTCKCSSTPDNILQCYLNTNLTVTNCNCVTFDELHDVTEAGMCMYNCGTSRKDEVSVTQPFPRNVAYLNDYLCSPFNRSGTLCGKCKDGHFPLAYSFDMNCVACADGKSNWWKYLFVAYLPLTIFYFIVLLFKINVTSSHFHGFVHYSQAISMPALSRILLVTTRNVPTVNLSIRYIGSLYGVWNLDFFRTFRIFGTCLQLEIMNIIILDLFIGLYPLLLMVPTYVLIHMYDRKYKALVVIWGPFQRFLRVLLKDWEIKTSLIDAFATFFLLSNLKFVSVSLDLLAPVKVYQLNATGHLTYSWRLYYNADIPYFGERHLPYAILGIVVLTFLVILPIILLIVYPFSCFQKVLNSLPGRWYILHTFMDAFQGCYKDGTESDSYDCRWFASTFFTVRVAVLLSGMLIPNVAFFPIAAISLILLSVLMVLVQPFKPKLAHHSYINSIFIILLALLYTSQIGNEMADEHSPKMSFVYIGVAVFLSIGPLLYISVIILHWFHSQRKFGIMLVKVFCAWRHGYSVVD